ncbi:hypothetical protein IAG44_19025 [Streptomyces roseirectus]|uniref:Transmembrane protein n=1 Tax=Streptomyces roseirectus TaxID=2768066 RepID=A0A7H0IEV3_9ACTN|nr:hypothetical protein [Streptomyces roseirectus]QNP71319.1 hypothetical protein IAG44_19025 [Streptomyces roseirectus]
MAVPHHLRPEDRADFEETLRLALVRTGQRDLKEQALADADVIIAASGTEYAAYVALRRDASRTPDAQSTALAALAVLTPIVSATSAAFLLLAGYVLQLADVSASLADSLVTAGWVLGVVAVLSTLLAVAALVRTAVRDRRGPASPAEVEQARLEWKRALLERGLVPYLSGSGDNSGRQAAS